MRLNTKKDILNLVNIIDEALNYISCNSNDSSLVLLNDTLEAFEYILSRIEEFEEIKDMINNAIQNVKICISNFNDGVDIKNNIKLTINLLYDIKNIIINEIEETLEIVFLPYKYSMWDSMESIWKSAIKDNNCSCKVIPIPYFELDNNRNIVGTFYEGDLFPKEIDIVHYDSYDIESIKPDIIYIHNPYDDCNKLTMIDPRFFSSKLKEYTDMLVYVPYYLDRSYPNCNTQEGVNQMLRESFSMLPALKNAHKIIAQTNTQKAIFKIAGNDENKIEVLGSPKIDYAVQSINNINNNKPYWYDENKKIFILSTGLASLLRYNNWIYDIENIIYAFLNDSDSILVWRHHPLMDITIADLRPSLYNKVNKIKKMIEDADNLYMDTSSSTSDIIYFSDGLIGDYSSVVFQYMSTEKPILGLFDKELVKPDRVYSIDYLGNYFYNIDTSIYEFKEIVKSKNDYKKEDRMKRFRNCMINNDGTCGEKIHSYIKNETIINLNNKN